MEGFLTTIAVKTRQRVALSKQHTSQADLEKMPLFLRTPQNVEPAFLGPNTNIIAEIKFASPSEGLICPNINPVEIAKDYLAHGASMLSVLTEPNYFKGDLTYLKAVRETFPSALLLRKDFILDPYQLYEAKAYGADCVLLIVAFNDPALTESLFKTAKNLGLSVLVEVHNQPEMEQALALGATFIGVNNRNLKTLQIDLDTSRQLIKYKTDQIIFICESGLKNAQDIFEMQNLGYNGFLIGSHFMKQSSIGHALSTLQNELSALTQFKRT